MRNRQKRLIGASYPRATGRRAVWLRRARGRDATTFGRTAPWERAGPPAAGARPETYVARDAAQQAAVASPLRLEILGQFLTREGLSIREVASRMGRSPGSLYHHFHRLESVGLLRRVGERPSGKRKESLYRPVAPRIALPASGATGRAAARRTMAAAFRMAERDLAAAIESPRARTTGRDRNTYAVRVHARLTLATLAEINGHLEAIEGVLGREAARREVPKDATELCSLTVALLPLRGRRPSGRTPGPKERKGRRGR